MKFEYTGRHIDVTDPIRAHVESHFEKLTHIFDDSTARAHIRIEVEKNRHIGEVVVHWRDHTMTATDTNGDMYLALTRAIHKIEKQAVKLKKKIIDRKQSVARISDAALEMNTADTPREDQPIAATAMTTRTRKRAGDAQTGITTDNTATDATDDGASGRSTPRIIPARTYPVKPMTAEEAAMRLQDEKDQFLVFRNADTERFSIIYKRSDGDFGLIEPGN